MSRVSREEFAAWLEGKPVRRARVKNNNLDATEVAAYLPFNYQVEGKDDGHVIIHGADVAGWTLDDYVIPRLSSGWITAKEI